MLILLNKYSNNGRGLKKWKECRPELEEKYIPRGYTLISDFKKFSKYLRQEVKKG